MATQSKRVAIIGAGASGLTAIKCCLDEGLEPVCFEKSDNIGGLWYYRENRDDQACVYESTVVNTSKEAMCYSDFPIPSSFPIFMHNRMVLKYYHLYADRFNLRRHIRLFTKVKSVVYADDYDQTGRWVVTVTSQTTGETVSEEFDGVMVCTGHFCTPHVPEFEGLKEFKGRVLHTHDYLNTDEFEKKKTLIIGTGNSGCDAATELARVSSKLFLSTRRGIWIIHRVGERSLPGDLVFVRRILGALPLSMKNKILKEALEKRVDHKLLGCEPKHHPFSQHPTTNDFLPNYILNGSILIKPDVKRFTPTGVVFQDGTTEDLDVVILATGYIFHFPFLDESLLSVKKNQLPLYKYVFPPDLKRPTLSFIGYVQPFGAINPISEMQSRWVARVIKGVTDLPSAIEMKADIKKKQEDMAKRYYKSQRHTIQVDMINYMDELAVQFGVKPDFWQMLKSDPVLAWKCVFGSFTPYQYRLVGPGRWEGAREAIMTIWDRVRAPTRSKQLQEETNGSCFPFKLLAVLVVAVAIWLVWF